MSNRIFVGGISWKADEQSLANFFSSYGKVIECRIIMDKVTKKSKGYGFVTFEDAESADKVKNSTNLYFLGKMMNVGDAMRKGEGTTSGGRTQTTNYDQGYMPTTTQDISSQPYFNVQNQNYYPQQMPSPTQQPQYYPYGNTNFGQTTYGSNQFEESEYQPAWQPMPGGSNSPPTTYQPTTQQQVPQTVQFQQLQMQLQQIQQLQQMQQYQQQLQALQQQQQQQYQLQQQNQLPYQKK